VQETPIELTEESYTVKHLKNIVSILQKTPGFDLSRILFLLGKIITKPETQELGQTVAEKLTQKIAARLIRNLLLENHQYLSTTNSLIINFSQ
jgi:hypothetical protein